ncbi:phage tail protein [Cronobacter sakazakii]
MSQTAITYAFEQWKAQQAATGADVVLDEFVFANVPGLDTSAPVDRAETLPDASMIVHRQAVTKTGLVNENAVVYSVVLSATTGDFSFNWIGLVNRASGTLAMIVHAPVQQKIKTAAGQQGNVLTRSFLMEYNGAANETAINTPADTWQIDFTARLDGADERTRVENIDLYGPAAFFGSGYQVVKTGAQYSVSPGVGYVAGLRSELPQQLDITVTTKPVSVWLDVAWRGSLTSVWGVESKVTVAETLANYEQNGVKHYVFAVARIEADGTITDLRPKGSLFLEKSKNLADVQDVSKARESLKLKGAALLDVGSEANTVAAGNDSRIVNALQVTKRPLAVDLNTLGQHEHIGIYCQDYDKNAKAEFHYPVMLSGTLTVTPSAYGCVQEYTTYSQSRKFIRGLVGAWNGSGPWAEWAEVYSTNRKPTPAEIGALSTAGGTAAYIDDALNFNVKGAEWKGAGSFAEQYKNAAAPFMKKYGYAALKGVSQYHPIIKGIICTDTYGYGTAVSLGMLTYGDARFAQGIIQVIGDNGVSKEWLFDPVTGDFKAPGVMSPGSYSNFDARYVLRDGVNWVGLIGGSENAPYIRSIASNNIIQLARTDWVINNYSSTAWVRQNFVSDVSLGAEGSFTIAKNAWQRVPGGCVLTGYNAEGDEPVNDTLFYRPIQKYYPAVGWMTIGHTA